MVEVLRKALVDSGFEEIPSQTRGQLVFKATPILMCISPTSPMWNSIKVWVRHESLRKIYGWNAYLKSDVLPVWKMKGHNRDICFESFEALGNIPRIPLYLHNPLVRRFAEDFLAHL